METSSSVKSDFLCFSPVGSLVSDNGTEFTLQHFSPARAFVWASLAGCLFSWNLVILYFLNMESPVKSGQKWSAGSEFVRKVGRAGWQKDGQYISLIFSGNSSSATGFFFFFLSITVYRHKRKRHRLLKELHSSLPWKFYPLLSNARWTWCPVQCSWNSSEFQVGSWQLCEYMNHIQTHQMNSISTVQISHT